MSFDSSQMFYPITHNLKLFFVIKHTSIMQSATILFKYKRKFKCCFGHVLLVRLKSAFVSNSCKLNVLFFGTDQFSLNSLILLDKSSKCENSKIARVDVATSLKSKGNPVKQYADKNAIHCFDWLTLNSNGAKIKYDLGVVVSFGHLLPENIINLFPLYVNFHVDLTRGMINLHASLLPRWRGASPIIYAILNEDAITGVSIMKIRPHKFDIGEVLAQKEVIIPKNVLMPELHQTLANDGGHLLVECIENAPESLQNFKEQGNQNATYAPKVPDSMAEINWTSMTAKHICNLYRALYSFKWLTTYWHKRRVRFRELDLPIDFSDVPFESGKSPGCIEYDKTNKHLRVFCGDGRCIFVKHLSLEGSKHRMTAADFNNGFLKKVDITQRFFTNIKSGT